MEVKSEKLKNACKAALLALQKLGNSEHDELRSKLEFVIGSYEFDKNPVGLYEFGEKALKALNNIKKKNPKKISKKIITDLETSLKP
ncbi:MAG: hypothetical protein JW723_10170 [Bacteroidales bacterium]|nr:hypothetical protein [Bacteroidales bacterium]